MSIDQHEIRAVKWLRDQHDPAKQDHSHGDRCEHCGYTRAPCEIFDLSDSWLNLIRALQDVLASMSSDEVRWIWEPTARGNQLIDGVISSRLLTQCTRDHDPEPCADPSCHWRVTP